MKANHLFTELPPWKFAARRLWQRAFTPLPCRVRGFAELFPGGLTERDGLGGIRVGFTGVLRRQPGRPFVVPPTLHRGAAGRSLDGEDSTHLACEPDRVVYSLAGAGVCTPMGFVYEPASRSFVRETLEHWDLPPERHPMLAAPGFPQAQAELPGISFLLSGFGADNFYHFLIDILPKLQLVGDLLPAGTRLLAPETGAGWHTAWIRRAGWPGDVHVLPPLAHLRCGQLIFGGRVNRRFQPNPWSVDAVRRLMGLPPVAQDEPAAETGEVLWLDRSRHPSRRVPWEIDLAQALRRRRPEIRLIAPEDHRPDALIALCRGARAVAGLHGAAFANQVFCRPGTRIVEILPQVNFPFYARLAGACGHRHTAVLAPENPQGADLEKLAGEIDGLLGLAITPH